VTRLGVLGSGGFAVVDRGGAVTSGEVTLDWLVGADDRWHEPAREASTRQHRLGAAPVVETIVRVPGGEVGQRAYGVAAASGAVAVVEIENRSAVPLTVGFVVRVAGRGRVELDGAVLRLDGRASVVMSSAPRARAAGANPLADVTGGRAGTEPIGELDAPVELALLFPVPHRTCVRAALGDLAGVEPGAAPIAVRDLPGADAVARGWERQLERGLQAALPSPVGELVDAARADLLLASRREPGVVGALEDWGFDDEAAAGWARLGWRARRHARRRPHRPDAWPAVRAADPATDPAGFLSALRAVLVREAPRSLELLPGFPTEWLGQPVTVDGLAVRAGSVSYAVRWHGARPALLWEAPAGVQLRAPALDPAWSSNASAGEALLAEPPPALLAMGTQERSAGERVDAPGQFS
jgi:hypothetical protein